MWYLERGEESPGLPLDLGDHVIDEGERRKHYSLPLCKLPSSIRLFVRGRGIVFVLVAKDMEGIALHIKRLLTGHSSSSSSSSSITGVGMACPCPTCSVRAYTVGGVPPLMPAWAARPMLPMLHWCGDFVLSSFDPLEGREV
jgi:hypothetical protein